MRYLAALLLLAAPLGAQTPAIAPARSVLFQAAPATPTQDTILVDDGIPQREGAFLGFVAGAGAGYLLTRIHFSGGDPTCNTSPCGTPKKDSPAWPVVASTMGAVVGMFIGSSLAGPHAPRPVLAPMSSADSLSQARRRGGKVGAILGGLIAGGAMAVIAARDGREPICDAMLPEHCWGGDGLDRTSVVLAIGAGAFSGYLIGRSIPARRPNPRPYLETEQPPIRDTGMKWWQGALTGGVIGGVGAPMLVKALRLDQQGGDVPAVAFAPMGALLGLVIGGSLAQAH